MTLLKDDGTVPTPITRVSIIDRPEISIKDGWYFGIGFGLALVVAVPIILLISLVIISLLLGLVGGL